MTDVPTPPIIPVVETCCECGEMNPAEEMIRHGSLWVCARCKPVFLQKLQEGAAVRGQLQYAGFWIRVGAKIIDVIILSGVNLIVDFVVGLLFGLLFVRSAPAAPGTIALMPILIMLVNYVLNLAMGAAYSTWLVGRYGATVGKMACGLRIVTPEGTPISYGRAFGRYFAEMLSGFTLGIGYIMVAFDDEKRGLHDRVCDTRVIKK